MANEFTLRGRPECTPTIYGYILPGAPDHDGCIKIGYTVRTARERIAEQTRTSGMKYKILFRIPAMRADGTVFGDRAVHRALERMGCPRLEPDNPRCEWFRCTEAQALAAVESARSGEYFGAERTLCFAMRPEQRRAVEKTAEYFRSEKQRQPDAAPKFLWNAKMRFGKTFAAYQLAKEMGFRRILILTFKPAVESAWAEDLARHTGFEGWQFVSNQDAGNQNIDIDQEYAKADQSGPIAVFGSFQDLLGTNDNGGIKAKNGFIHRNRWDLVIFDEYHYGAWRENAKNLFKSGDEEEESDFDPEKYKRDEADNAVNESFLPITAEHYLFLSGTPFRALNSGEFIEEQIFSWTYSDEQRAKEEWKPGDGPNPYAALPRMVMFTYRIPDSIRQIAVQGEFNEFDLNLFFAAEGSGENARFKYENEVQKWLDLIRGAYLPSGVDDLKLGQNRRPPMPYSDVTLLNVLRHTLWYLPSVAACEAMANLLKKRNNIFYKDYEVIDCSGPKAGIGAEALETVLGKIGDPLKTKSITLSCGKLTTGVTVHPWSGVFMLRNLKSPETYFQTAFRAQSPWTVRDDDGEEIIMKPECFIFDFALDRALRQISDYSRRLNVGDSDPEARVAEFTKFLPVLAYDGSTWRQISASDILDIAMAGTSATLLARRWESALLVNVDNDTLRKLLASPEAMRALEKIEGFRSLNRDIETILTKSDAVKKAKAEPGKMSSREKRELTEEERELKSKRRQIQEKLIKFAARIPVFMYLSDFRERSLKDVITQLEPDLFRRVTGLEISDFDLLCGLGLFNASLMDDAVYKFKRYEDASLEYTGINRHAADSRVGGFETAVSRETYRQMFPETATAAAAAATPPEPVSGAPVDWSGITCGAAVIHRKLGPGKIVQFANRRTKMKIQLERGGEKMLDFPGAFASGTVTLKPLTLPDQTGSEEFNP